MRCSVFFLQISPVFYNFFHMIDIHTFFKRSFENFVNWCFPPYLILILIIFTGICVYLYNFVEIIYPYHNFCCYQVKFSECVHSL